MTINRGDIYWVELASPSDDDPAIPHPYVILQDNVFNHSRITTVVACALTSNLKQVSWPGNVLLEEGEANLPRRSVVEVSKISTLDKAQLGARIGTLSDARVQEILAGLRFLHHHYWSAHNAENS